MAKYLTVNQYLAADDGVPFVSTLPVTTVARMVARAESAIDSYMGFDLRLGGFEPHTAWVQFPWDYHNLRTRVPNIPVPIRTVTRYRIQISNISTAGAGFFANINAGDVAYNVFDSYVEIVPLQAVTYSLVPVIVQLGLQPPIVQMDYEVGYYLPSFSEPFYDSGDGKTWRALRGFWATSYDTALNIQPNVLPPIPPVIYINGVKQTSGYTINTTEGTVTFSSPQTGQTITGDITYTIPDTVRDAAIAQTSWLLGQRNLNTEGMLGLESSSAQGRNLRRGRVNPRESNARTALAHEALALLEPYVEIPVF